MRFWRNVGGQDLRSQVHVFPLNCYLISVLSMALCKLGLLKGLIKCVYL